MMNVKHDIARLRERLAQIKASKVTLTGKQKDALAAFCSKAADLLRDSMPTHTQMKKGLANAHREMKMNLEPVFGVAGYEDVLRAMNIKIKSGKVSRNDLSIAWKIGSKYLEEESNVEYLRKDYKNNTYQLERTIEECEQD